MYMLYKTPQVYHILGFLEECILVFFLENINRFVAISS